MAKMRIVRGEDRRVSVLNGAGVLSAGDPVKFSSGTVVAATNGARIDGVMVDDAAANATNCRMSILKDGDMWEVTVSSLTAEMGSHVAAAGSGIVDAGTSGDSGIGWICDADVAAADTTCKIVIDRAAIA